MSTLKMVKNARRKRRTRMEMLMRRRVTTRNTSDFLGGEEEGPAPDLIFVIFSPHTKSLDKFFSTQKCVNHVTTDFATKLRKLQKN